MWATRIVKTEVLRQPLRIPSLPFYLTDPFGLDWNPFGFDYPGGEPPRLDMAIVGHAEVALILIGHLVSVYLAHRVALRLFPTRRAAMVSQIPMLLLMVTYTIIGLWVISLPFALTGRECAHSALVPDCYALRLGPAMATRSVPWKR